MKSVNLKDIEYCLEIEGKKNLCWKYILYETNIIKRTIDLLKWIAAYDKIYCIFFMCLAVFYC